MEDSRRYHSYHIDDQLELLSLIGSREQWETSEELYHYATHAPHINSLSVREHPQHDLWSPVEPTLNISVDDLFVEGATAKVSNDYATLVLLFQEYVLWFQVTVYDSECLHVLETAHELNGESAYESLLEASVVVHLDELVEVETEEVEGHAEVVPEHEVVLDLYHALLVLRVVFLY